MASEINSFGQALKTYAELISHPSNLETLAEKTVELSKLAHNVMQAATPNLRAAASDLEHLLTAPYSVQNKSVSILGASEHFSENPKELSELIDALNHNKNAFQLLCNELTLLSSEATQRPSQA